MLGVVDAALMGLNRLKFKHGVESGIQVLGVSMGGHAALEFARTFPDRVQRAAVIAGYYPEAQIDALVQATAAIPLLLVHRKGDYACPFRLIQSLHLARIGETSSKCAETE
ncbi:unnamed protein product, partial [Polarella glacialis]